MIAIPTINMSATGMNITRLRKSAGLSVRDLADILGFATPQAVYKWQNGVAMPTLDNLVVLAAIFNVTMDQIIVVDTDAKVQISA
jgi:predicted transcriptional regulators